MSAMGGPQEFVEFQLHRFAVAVLRILDEEHHQEGDDGGGGIDHELPGVTVMKEGACDEPDDDENSRQHKRNGPPRPPRGGTSEFAKAPFAVSRLSISPSLMMRIVHQCMLKKHAARRAQGKWGRIPGKRRGTPQFIQKKCVKISLSAQYNEGGCVYIIV